MNVIQIFKWHTLTALVALCTTVGLIQHVAAQQATAAIGDGMEILTRGPIHEAFAETITFDSEPGVVVAKAPPAPIEEIAPDQRPQGDNVTWIPGYWAWDDERNDYLWISGIWRTLPPGRQWVPGYWGESPQGSQWTSGYWADAAATEIEYLPAPPATVETGPNVAAPSADDIWLPGSWVWQNNRYGWRPGYWSKGNPDWVWVPDHYVRTPRGYVFVDGYYDYSVQRRGVVFAPVYFHGGLHTRRGFSYSPSTAINPAAFVRHLFLRPSYGHYYFGDYYGSNYTNAGFSPWFSYQSSRRGYDPIYSNQRWQNRGDRQWEQRTQADYQNLRDNENARPPRNWAAQSAIISVGETATGRNSTVALPFDELSRRDDAWVRFTPVDPAERKQYGRRGQQYRKYLQERRQSEASAALAPGDDPANTVEPVRRTFAQSPFTSQPVEKLKGDYVPPQRHEVLKPDSQVQPQARDRRGRPGADSGVGPGATRGEIEAAPRAESQQHGVRGGIRQREPVDQLQGQGVHNGSDRQDTPVAEPAGQKTNQAENPQAAPAEQSQGESSQGQEATGGENQQRASDNQQQDSSQGEPVEEPEE